MGLVESVGSSKSWNRPLLLRRWNRKTQGCQRSAFMYRWNHPHSVHGQRANWDLPKALQRQPNETVMDWPVILEDLARDLPGGRGLVIAAAGLACFASGVR